MKKTRKVMAIILLLCLALTAAGCNQMDEREVAVRTVLAQFQQACNIMDYDTIMSCLAPAITDTMDVASDILDIFIDTETKDIFDLLTGIVSTDFVAGEDFFTTMMIDVKYVDFISETAAKVFTAVTYQSDETQTYSNVVFSCVLSKGKWYIGNFEFV